MSGLEYKFDHKPMCRFCTKAKKLPDTEDMLCEKYGVVSAEHSCKKFRYNLLAREVRRKKELDTSRFSVDDFRLD